MMRAFIIAQSLSLVLAYQAAQKAAIYISSIGGEPADNDLQIESGRLVAGSKMTPFCFDTDGTMKIVKTGQYLSVGEKGRLIVSDYPHFGFDVTEDLWRPSNYVLSYNKIEEFELCGDRSIGCKSQCTGSKKIKISFDILDID